MKKSWFNYYKNHNGVAVSNIFLHWPYLLQILLMRPKKMLEIGCGPADHSLFISSLKSNTNISLLDYDKKIISKLKNKFKNKFDNYYICDITNKTSVKKLDLKNSHFDLIYSQGLMEHFMKKDFQAIINNFLPYTKKMVMSIPAENYPNRDFGNELLRNKKQLTEIMNQIKNIEFKIYKYFPDIGLRAKIIKIKKEKLGFKQSLLLIFFDSLHYLIEINKKN